MVKGCTISCMWSYKTHILYDEMNFSAITELHATDISILSYIQISLYSSMAFQFSLLYALQLTQL